MSYLAPRTRALEIAVINWTTKSANTDATLSVFASSWATAPNVSSGRLVLPAGHYRFCAAVGLTRTVAASNVLFAVQEYDGTGYTTIGSEGQSDMYLNAGNNDLAEGVLDVTAGATKDVTVRVLQVEGSMPTITSADSTLVVWRTDL